MPLLPFFQAPADNLLLPGSVACQFKNLRNVRIVQH